MVDDIGGFVDHDQDILLLESFQESFVYRRHAYTSYI
jgi:hypothetical protein